jgi:hypothetical protein
MLAQSPKALSRFGIGDTGFPKFLTRKMPFEIGTDDAAGMKGERRALLRFADAPS